MEESSRLYGVMVSFTNSSMHGQGMNIPLPVLSLLVLVMTAHWVYPHKWSSVMRPLAKTGNQVPVHW